MSSTKSAWVFVDYSENTEFHVETVEPVYVFTKKTQVAPNILGMDVISRFNLELKKDISMERNRDLPPEFYEFREK